MEKDWKKKYHYSWIDGEALCTEEGYAFTLEDLEEELDKVREEGYDKGFRRGLSQGWEEGGDAFLELKVMLKEFHKEGELYTKTLKRVLSKLNK